MPSAPSEHEFKTRILLVLGAKKSKRETKWELVSKAGWHLKAATRDRYLQDMIDEGLLVQFLVHKYLKRGRRPTEFELTDKGIKIYREAAKNHRQRIPI